MPEIGDSIDLVVGIVVAAFVGSALLPTAIEQFTSVSFTDPTLQALWTLIPLFAILAFALYFISATDTSM